MDDLRLHAVVARVVAWHNRHPLARRITAAQVNSVGYVALPYTAPGLPPPPPPSLPPPPAAPEPEPEPEPEPAPPPGEQFDIDPGIDTDDPGAIDIDVDSEPRPDTADDPDALMLEVEITTATADDAPIADAASDQQPSPAPGPQSGDDPRGADPLPAPPPAPVARPASSLRARATAGAGDAESPPAASPDPMPLAALPAPGAPRTLVCSEDFMAPLPIKQVLAWVGQHGLALARSPSDGPVREVPADPALLPAGAGVAQLWVATAAIDIGGQRHLLLLSGSDEPAVLGRRAWSPLRLLGALVAPCVLVAALAWLMWPAAKGAKGAKGATGAHDAPVAAMPVLVSASTASAASASAGSASAASAPEAGTSASTVAAEGEPHAASAVPLRLPPLLDDAAKAEARATVAALRAARFASAPAAVAPSPAAPEVQPALMFGLSTPLLRTRAEAEQLQSALQTLLGVTPGSPLRVEMLPAGEDWRVVCWPYERRIDAERSRALLRARGLRVELVDF